MYLQIHRSFSHSLLIYNSRSLKKNVNTLINFFSDDSSQATIEYYSDDDDDLPDEDPIEMAMGRIFRYQDEHKDANNSLYVL